MKIHLYLSMLMCACSLTAYSQQTGKKVTEQSPEIKKLQEQRQEILQLQKEDSIARAQVALGDSSIVRFANRCLFETYDKDQVELARSLFARIQNPEMKDNFKVVGTLLGDYRNYLEELQRILTILSRIQTIGAFKDRARGELNKWSYYRKCYRESWNIPYLSTLYMKINAEIDKNNPSLNKNIDYRSDFTVFIREVNTALK